MATETIRRSVSSGWGDSDAPEGVVRPSLVVVKGPLLRELESQPATSLEAYRSAGGYGLAEEIARAPSTEPYLLEIDRAGVRGRGGGGYPAAHKWYLVARKEGARYLVCNAHARPGDLRIPHLLATAPHKVVEAIAVAALLAGAQRAILALPGSRPELVAMLAGAVDEANAAGLFGGPAAGGGLPLQLRLFETADSHVAGEETALLEAIEGRRAAPRGKPPLPVASGLFGAPTAVSNLETVLQAFLALKVGSERFRSVGTPMSPGTMLFTLHGEVVRPGLYEMPLGTTLRTLIEECGGGLRSTPFRCVFPGGMTTPPIGEEGLDLPLEFDAVREAGSDLGCGEVVAVAGDVSAPALATELARQFHQASCGKCRPCKDGTERTATMLQKLERLDEKSIDLSGREIPTPKRRYALKILGQSEPTAPTGISYTDMTSGLGKIVELCEFFRYRGDCHHSVAAANVLLRLLDLFRPEFEARVPAPAAQEVGAHAPQPT